MVPDSLLAGEDAHSFVVHAEHEAALREFVTFLRRSRRPFMISLGLTLSALPLIAILAVAFGLPEGSAALPLGICVSLVGAVLIVFPFSTPETVGLLGIRKASWVVRGLGMILSGAGILIAVVAA
jgi:hypothetical protein